MRIVHVSRTPCAGAIEALSSAIRDYTEHDSRVINGGGKVNNLHFPEDVTWASTEVFPLLSRADVIVCHQNVDHKTAPVRDFLDGDKDKRVVGFYHSHPDACNPNLAKADFPHFCVAQYQALLWEKATPVRNVIRFERADWPERVDRDDGKFWIGYAPTFRQSQKGEEKGSLKWHHSKGYDVTMPVLQAIDKKYEHVEVMLFEGIRYESCIQGKAMCDVLIDEVVTGSYHRSTLEGLALGIPTIANISPKVHGVIVKVAGANDVPVIHATADTLEEQLAWLVEMDPVKRRRIGNQARDWMVRHWHPRDIAREFCEALEGTRAPVSR